MLSPAAGALLQGARSIVGHRLAVAAVAVATSRYLSAILNFGTNALVARWLGTAEYGLLALVIAYPTLLWSFVGTKSVSVVTRYMAAFQAKGQDDELLDIVKAGYLLDVSVACLAFILVVATGWWVSGSIYHRPEVGWLMVIYAASFPLFSLAGGSSAVLTAWKRFGLLAGLEVLHPTLKLVLVVGLVAAGLGSTGAVIGLAAAQASAGLIMMVAATFLLVREGKGLWWRASLEPLARMRGELATFFGWNYLVVTLSGLVEQLPVIFLGSLRGPEQAGFYRLAASITTVGSYMESSLTRVVYPVLSARWGVEEPERIPASLRRWTLAGGLPASLLLVVVIPLLPRAIAVAFGHAYQPTALGAQLMMIGTAVSALFFWLSALYYSAGAVKLWTLGYAAYCLFVILAGWFAIQWWGFLGIAGSVAMGKIAFIGLMVAMLKRVMVKR